MLAETVPQGVDCCADSIAVKAASAEKAGATGYTADLLITCVSRLS